MGVKIVTIVHGDEEGTFETVETLIPDGEEAHVVINLPESKVTMTMANKPNVVLKP